MPPFLLYQLKVSLILSLFYVVYWLLLSNETQFKILRSYLLLGLLVALLLPLFPLYKYVVLDTFVAHTVPSEPVLFSIKKEGLVSSPIIDTSFWLGIIYGTGALFFFVKLLWECASIQRLILKNVTTQQEELKLVWVDKPIAPFSFFHWVFLPKKLDENKKHQILAHEKIHSQQWHNVDILFCQLVLVFLWWNPMLRLYKNAMQQNLEFMADQGAMAVVDSPKSYQKTLLSVMLQTPTLSTVHNFNKSFLKKRILMMKKPQTPVWHGVKCLAVVPLLFLFMTLANTKTVAQVPEKPSEKIEEPVPPEAPLPPKNESSTQAPPPPPILPKMKKKIVIKRSGEVPFHMIGKTPILITNTMTDVQLEALQEVHSEKGNTLKISKLKRNAAGKISQIKIRWIRPSGEDVHEASNPNGIANIVLNDQHMNADTMAHESLDFSFSKDSISKWVSKAHDKNIMLEDSLMHVNVFSFAEFKKGHKNKWVDWSEEDYEALEEKIKDLDYEIKIFAEDAMDSLGFILELDKSREKIHGGLFISSNELDTLDEESIRHIKVIKVPNDDETKSTKKKIRIFIDEQEETP